MFDLSIQQSSFFLHPICLSKDVNQRHTEEDYNTQFALNGDSSGASLDEDIGIGDFFGTDSLLLYLFRIN